MFFILHYILFEAGLSAALILITLYLQTYSDASLTEIGALLMLLPFVSILAKPLFCALADRQQAHRQYLAGALLVTAAGYGSIAIAPFFPNFVAKHGRLVWYLDVLGILVGYSGFGVVWSLGDALAVNMARAKGIPWGHYRVWATVSWGVFGWLIGQINETPMLPKYTPAFFVLVGSLTFEALLVMIWDKKYFDMSAGDRPVADAINGAHKQQQQDSPIPSGKSVSGGLDADIFDESHWPSTGGGGGGAGGSMTGTLSGSTRTNPRLMGAVANIFMEDLAGSLKSSLKIGAPAKRVALSDLLKQHDLVASSLQRPVIPAVAPSPSLTRMQQQQQSSSAGTNQPPPPPPLSPIPATRPQVTERGDSERGTGGRSTWTRTQLMLAHMNSLSSASGTVIADQLRDEFDTSAGGSPTGANGNQVNGRPAATMIMSSLASSASLGRAAAARATGFGSSTMKTMESMGEQPNALSADVDADAASGVAPEQVRKSVEDLQLVLLKLIVKRDRSILKFLLLFVLFGSLVAVHTSYFFLYVEKLAREKAYDFSAITGLYLLAQSISEIFSFLVVVPYYMPLVGRVGSLSTCALMFFIRYLYYGTYFADVSLYYGLVTECCHGIAYAITYTLITDIASECVDQVDSHMPELISRRIIDPAINPNELKLPLRATMQGVFSGAFDGLGNGLGCIFAGIYLDSYSFAHLSLLCTYLSLAILGVYPLSEWRSRWVQRRAQKSST